MTDETNSAPPAGAPDFSHLKQAATQETAEYEIYELEGIAEECPVLIVRGTADNAPYLTALKLRRPEISRAVTKQQRKNKRLRPGDLAADLLGPIDKEIYAGAVVIDWRNVANVQKEPVPFTVENCKGFLAALPNSLFEGLRIFCNDVRNFRVNPDGEDDDDDAEDAAKN